MGKSTIFAALALGLALAPSAAAAAAASANVPGLSFGNRAGKPHYDKGGWLCPPGLVWRNAGRTDWLCVDPLEARQIQQENRNAPGNWIQQPDGSQSCRSGLVTRDAFKRDVVCVDPARRESVLKMNNALYSLR